MLNKLLALVFTFCLLAMVQQDNKQPDENQLKEKEKQVNAAIYKGAKWLHDQTELYFKNVALGFKPDNAVQKAEELILYTLVHSGMNEKNATFNTLMTKVWNTTPYEKTTYRTSVEAVMWLGYDRKRFQERIADCAQSLVDSQCKNGQWSYAIKSLGRGWKDMTPVESPFDTHRDPKKQEQLKKITVQRQCWGGKDKGDNSNTQYAALGLRACTEANIEIDPEVLKFAKECWEQCQNKDGGWNYKHQIVVKDPNTGGTQQEDSNKNIINPSEISYGSMSVGGLGALASYKHLLKEEIKKDSYLKNGTEWVSKNFAVDKNPNKVTVWHYYYLYGLERAAAMLNLEKFGDHDWYWEGADYLLKNQNADGSWKVQDVVTDTCFAILFLKRATRKMVTPIKPPDEEIITNDKPKK